MKQQKSIKTAPNGLFKAAGELYQAVAGKNVDDKTKIRATFSHEK
jgi:hypothetical protein